MLNAVEINSNGMVFIELDYAAETQDLNITWPYDRQKFDVN